MSHENYGFSMTPGFTKKFREAMTSAIFPNPEYIRGFQSGYIQGQLDLLKQLNPAEVKPTKAKQEANHE